MRSGIGDAVGIGLGALAGSGVGPNGRRGVCTTMRIGVTTLRSSIGPYVGRGVGLVRAVLG